MSGFRSIAGVATGVCTGTYANTIVSREFVSVTYFGPNSHDVLSRTHLSFGFSNLPRRIFVGATVCATFIIPGPSVIIGDDSGGHVVSMCILIPARHFAKSLAIVCVITILI